MRPRLAGLPDPEVMAIAATENRTLVTHDAHTMPRHFGDFLTAGHSSPGVLLVSQHAPIGDVIDELVLIWAVCEPEEYRNRFIRIL